MATIVINFMEGRGGRGGGYIDNIVGRYVFHFDRRIDCYTDTIIIIISWQSSSYKLII